MKLDKYARDFAVWRDWAAINYRAAQVLFETKDPFMLFPAATLGHHALEMYLKSALVSNGMTVFDPKMLKQLDPEFTLGSENCVWGHELLTLAQILAGVRPSFSLSKQIDFIGVVIETPITVEKGLKIFDPFFSELRYPREMKLMGGLGEEHGHLLDSLVRELREPRLNWNRSS